MIASACERPSSAWNRNRTQQHANSVRVSCDVSVTWNTSNPFTTWFHFFRAPRFRLQPFLQIQNLPSPSAKSPYFGLSFAIQKSKGSLPLSVEGARRVSIWRETLQHFFFQRIKLHFVWKKYHSNEYPIVKTTFDQYRIFTNVVFTL